jgi:hypothetical protein
MARQEMEQLECPRIVVYIDKAGRSSGIVWNWGPCRVDSGGTSSKVAPPDVVIFSAWTRSEDAVVNWPVPPFDYSH